MGSEMLVNRKRTLKLANGRPAKAMWRAVETRDRGADGAFVFAVRSTGIYCKPSCPSRRPRREQVIFFSFAEAAEQEGFRACKRCRPSAAPAADPNIEKMRGVCRAIDGVILEDAKGEAGMDLSLAGLSAKAGMGPHQLERAFRRAMGITPRQYADAQRMR